MSKHLTCKRKTDLTRITRGGGGGGAWGGGGRGGREGGGGGQGVTFYIWHSTDVRAEWPPFSALPGI